MIYRQCYLDRDINGKLILKVNQDDDIDRVYRKYKPYADVLSIPVRATSESKSKEVKLEHGIIDMISQTKKEVIEQVMNLNKYLLELEEMSIKYAKEQI